MPGLTPRSIVVALVGLLVVLAPLATRAADLPPDGRVIMAPDGTLYLMQGGQRHPIEPLQLSAAEVAVIPEGEPIPNNVLKLSGGSSASTSVFNFVSFEGELGPMQFGTGVDSNDRVVNPTRRFPAGTTKIYTFFTTSGVAASDQYTSVNYVNGKEWSRSTFNWEPPEKEGELLTTSGDDGLDEGAWEKRIMVGDEVVLWGFFTVGTPPPPPTTGGLAFSRALDDEGRAVNAATSFPAGTGALYFVFTQDDIPVGVSYGFRVLRDGQPYLFFEDVWSETLASKPTGWIKVTPPGGTFGSGKYDVTLVINSAPVQRSSFSVAS